MHLAALDRRGEPALGGGERSVVGFEERPLIHRIDREPQWQRLPRDWIGAGAFDPVEVDGATSATFGEIVLQPVLHRQIRRMRGVGAGHHDGGVDVAEHRLVAGARGTGAFLQNGTVERDGHGLLEHVNDAEIDAARAHDFIADVREQVGKRAGMRDRQHALAGLEGELLDDAPRHGGIVEGQARLRRQRHGDSKGDEEACEAFCHNQFSAKGPGLFGVIAYRASTSTQKLPSPHIAAAPPHQTARTRDGHHDSAARLEPSAIVCVTRLTSTPNAPGVRARRRRCLGRAFA